MTACSGRYGTDQAFGAGADEIFPVGSNQGFPHQIIVFGIAVLDQCPLHGLFVGIRGNIDLVHGSGIQAGIVHDGGEGRGGGIEILHLLRVITHFPDVLGQLNGFLQQCLYPTPCNGWKPA